MFGHPYLEAVLSGAALLVVVVYHVLYAIRFRRRPLSTHLGRSHHTRAAWVRGMMNGERDVLPVQTLRNWTMAATFLASAAILIALGVFNAAVTGSRSEAVSSFLDLFGASSQLLWQVKLLCLGVVFFSAFFSFTLAVRSYNHAGFLINLLPEDDAAVTPERVAAILNRGASSYHLGMRAYYIGIPTALWTFGALWLLLGSLVLILMLRRLDSADED